MGCTLGMSHELCCHTSSKIDVDDGPVSKDESEILCIVSARDGIQIDISVPH